MENQEFLKALKPRDYLKIFFRRKWLLIAPVFAGLVLSIMAIFLLPPQYESSTTIMVEEEKIMNPLIGNLAVSTTAAQRMQSIREILLGWNSLVELTKKVNLAKEATTQSQYEGLIRLLQQSIQVQMPNSNIIKISYTGGDPKQTQLITKTLTDILIERNKESQTKETDVAINFIQEQLAIYKRKIKESEIAKLEDELKNLLVDSTEQHPLVRELRQKIAVAKKELESGEYQVVASEQPIAEATREALKTELDKIIGDGTRTVLNSAVSANQVKSDSSASIYKLLLMDKVGNSMARDINVNENIYQMLLQRLETAKITQRLEASKQGTHYTIIDPPRVPLKPSKPNKILIIFLGLLLGTFAGTGLVFGREFLDHSFLDIEDAKQNLEFPVLGAISRITTQEEIDKEKSLKKKWIKISSITAVAFIVISILFSFIRR